MNKVVRITATPNARHGLQVNPAAVKLSPGANFSPCITVAPTAQLGLQVNPSAIAVSPGNSGDMPVIWETYEKYDGAYEVVPSSTAQTLATENKVMKKNLRITEIPYYETSNLSGGNTVYIGKEIAIYGKQ